MRKLISQGNCVTVWCLDECTSWLVCCRHFDRLSVWIMLLFAPHCWEYPFPFTDAVLFSPSRFMESELDLNDIIQEMHVVATMPDLYHLLVELNAVQSLLGLLGHDNTDILSDMSSVGRLTGWGNTVYSLLLSVSADVCCSRLVFYFHSNYLPSWNTRCSLLIWKSVFIYE